MKLARLARKIELGWNFGFVGNKLAWIDRVSE